MDERIEKKVSILNRSVMGLTAILGIYIGLFLRNKLPPQIPLFYSKPWGEEQLAKPIQLIIPFVLIGVCSGLFGIVKKAVHDEVLKSLILGGVVVIEILFLLAILRIVLIIS